MSGRRERGFTLIEVMIALMVLAIALGAIIQAVGRTAENVSYLRDKTFSHWVAMNKIAEWQSLNKPPKNGSGTETMAGQEWFWSVEVEDVSEVDVQQLRVEIKRDRRDKQAITSLVSLLGKNEAKLP